MCAVNRYEKGGIGSFSAFSDLLCCMKRQCGLGCLIGRCGRKDRQGTSLLAIRIPCSVIKEEVHARSSQSSKAFRHSRRIIRSGGLAGRLFGWHARGRHRAGGKHGRGQRSRRRHHHHRLLGASSRSRLARSHQHSSDRGSREIPRHQPGRGGGDQRREPPDQPGRDLHQRQSGCDSAAADGRCCAYSGGDRGHECRHPRHQRRPRILEHVRRSRHHPR